MSRSNNKTGNSITSLELGDNWVVDDITGFRIPASEAVHGEGLMLGMIMHRDTADKPNHQLFLKPGPADDIASKIVRTRPTDIFD